MTFELGLKGSMDNSQLDDRLKYLPTTYEFHLNWEDLENLNILKNQIQKVFDADVKNIVLHHPMKTGKGEANESYLDKKRNKDNYNDWEYSTKTLGNISKYFTDKGYNIKTLVHLNYGGKNPTYKERGYSDSEAQDNLFKNILMINKEFGDLVIFENGIQYLDGLSLTNKDIQSFIIDNNIKLCLDVSHAYISFKGNMYILENIMEILHDNITHYHIVDSFGKVHDSLVIGKGSIKWDNILEKFNKEATSIYEINLKDMKDCTEMIDSYLYIQDRIAFLEKNNFVGN